MARSPVFLELERIKAATKIAAIVGRGQNRVFLESDTLMMNLTSGFNSNLERKTVAEQNAPAVASSGGSGSPMKK